MKRRDLKKGTKVIIVLDVRATERKRDGQEAVFIGNENKEAWILFNKRGKAAKESYTLPRGYVEWDPSKERFPERKCGMKSKNPKFKLADGEEITGGQCYWEPKNPKIKKRITGEENDLMKRAQKK